MKHTTLLAAAGLLLLPASWAMAQEEAQTKTLTVEVANAWTKSKTDAPVVVDLNALELDFAVRSAVVMDGDTELASQLDDLSGDLLADELAFVVDVPAQTTKTLTVTLSSAPTDKAYEPRTFAQFLIRDAKSGKHAPIKSVTVPGTVNFYNMVYSHGPMFESELVAYRVYFNEKQTIDPYGKYSCRLELPETTFYTSPEQQAAGYGNDVMIVSNSVGIGALKGWNGEQSTHITPVAFRTETLQASGPVRAIVDVTAEGWQYQGSTLTMTTRYTLYAGHRDMKVEGIFTAPLQNEVFCSGVMNILGDETVSYSDHDGLLGSWGRHWPESDTIRWRKETAGIGTYIPKAYRGEEVSDKEDFLYTISAPGQSRFYYFTTFGSQNESFGYHTSEEWFAYLKEWEEELLNPVAVTVKP